MSGVQEGQGRPLNLLITLSPNFPSRHSLTLTALCALAQSCCSQKHRLVITTRTSNQTTVCRRSRLTSWSALVTSGHQRRIACRPLDYWL